MPERRIEYTVDSFDAIKRTYISSMHVSKMVAEGDNAVYTSLHPLSERAFNYRDVIDVENHVTGIEIVKAHVDKENGPLLYLASSYGLGSLLLKNAGYDVVSLDPDLQAVYFAKQYAPLQVNADGTLLPFINESFQAVVSRDFLAKDYHSLSRADHTLIMNELYRVLKNGGKGIFYTLYCMETENSTGIKVRQGLPNMSMLLRKFETVEQIKMQYKDNPQKNSLVLVTTK